MSTDLTEVFVPTLNGQALKVDLMSGVAIIDVNADTENATVTTADVKAGNGVVHIIDEVLVPETTNDIVDVASATDFLSTLVTTLSNYPDLVEALSDDEGNFTVFAPTNDAFSEISSVIETLTSDQIKEVLQYHVTNGRVYSTSLSDGLAPEMLNGETITINIGDAVTVSDKDGANTDATVTTTDIQTLNGVVHIIDKVLIPEL